MSSFSKDLIWWLLGVVDKLPMLAERSTELDREVTRWLERARDDKKMGSVPKTHGERDDRFV